MVPFFLLGINSLNVKVRLRRVVGNSKRIDLLGPLCVVGLWCHRDCWGYLEAGHGGSYMCVDDLYQCWRYDPNRFTQHYKLTTLPAVGTGQKIGSTRKYFQIVIQKDL